jgi:hypothetical protein
MNKPTQLILLRLFLLAAAGGWGATVVGVFLPWDFALEHLQLFGGAGAIPDDPMLNYWMRMAAGAFGMIGMLFLVAAWKPQQYANIIPLLGLLNLGEGLMLLAWGTMLNLGLFPFGVDVAIGIVPGIGILMLRGALDS